MIRSRSQRKIDYFASVPGGLKKLQGHGMSLQRPFGEVTICRYGFVGVAGMFFKFGASFSGTGPISMAVEAATVSTKNRP
ncbi:MAG: hypothetical protein IPN19_09595 [Elusimicrobia bacterium]|nr:hypothetical protein [Elusimicrobiota bacterium]